MKKLHLDVDRVLEIYNSARVPCPKCGRLMTMLDDYHWCFSCKISKPYDK